MNARVLLTDGRKLTVVRAEEDRRGTWVISTLGERIAIDRVITFEAVAP